MFSMLLAFTQSGQQKGSATELQRRTKALSSLRTEHQQPSGTANWHYAPHPNHIQGKLSQREKTPQNVKRSQKAH